MDLTTASRGELLKLVYELMDKVELLQAENARLQELLKQKSDNPPSRKVLPYFIKPNIPLRKTAERKLRDQSFHRLKETPDQKVFHTVSACPHCGRKRGLGRPVMAYTRQIIDLPPVPYTVTEHVIFKRWCPTCQRRVTPEVDLAKAAFGKKRIGLGLASTIVTLRERLRLPVRVIRTYLKMFHQLRLSDGEIVELLHAAARVGQPHYEQLLAEARGSPVVHADETGGRENGRNGYFWSLNTPRIHYLMYRKSRGKNVVEEFCGPEGTKFNGVLISDFYAAYNTYTGFHQRCWVHLLRDIKELRQLYRKHPPLNIWAKKVRLVYTEAKAYLGPEGRLPAGLAQQERIDRQHEFEHRLEAICQPYLAKESPMSPLSGRIINFLPELFTFIRFPNVPSDNNPAERILRHTVIARKIQGGTRSFQGSQTKAILTSLFGTWQLQGKDPLTECRLLLASS